MKIVSVIVVAAMSITFFLLAFQAEPVTAVLGYVWGTVLSLAVINQLRGK